MFDAASTFYTMHAFMCTPILRFFFLIRFLELSDCFRGHVNSSYLIMINLINAPPFLPSISFINCMYPAYSVLFVYVCTCAGHKIRKKKTLNWMFRPWATGSGKMASGESHFWSEVETNFNAQWNESHVHIRSIRRKEIVKQWCVQEGCFFSRRNFVNQLERNPAD